MSDPALAIAKPGSSPLARLELACRLLAEARTLDEVKVVVDLAEAARTYARQAQLGLEAQNNAAEVRLRAERRAGELLAAMRKHAVGVAEDEEPWQSLDGEHDAGSRSAAGWPWRLGPNAWLRRRARRVASR